MPGTWNNAKRALKAANSGKYRRGDSSRGIESISDGNGSAYRLVFRIGDYVYKVCSYAPNDDMNEREHKFFRAHIQYPWSSRSQLFHVEDRTIICMPYYEGRSACPDNTREISDLWHEYMSVNYDAPKFIASDLHSDNFRLLHDGTYKLLDAGGSGW